MTSTQFNEKLNQELTIEELALINPNIYFNPEYTNYYNDYHSEKYQKCYDFLMENKNILKIENTPKEFKKVALANIKNAKLMMNNEI